jgi:LPS-assembly lipoprotein
VGAGRGGTPLLLRRRDLLVWPLILALPGCGLHPLYATNDSGPGPARAGLGLISVAIIPSRPGQLLRQALQARFDHGDAPSVKRYDLAVSFGVSGEGIGLQQDNTVTRIRFIGDAKWTLSARDVSRGTVTSGSARSVDGLNTFDQQYFAEDIETETVQRRISEAVADQITEQLALYFAQHPA